MSHRTIPIRPRTLRRRLALVAFGGILAATAVAYAAAPQAHASAAASDAGVPHMGFLEFILQLAAMLILTGSIVAFVLLSLFTLYEWWAGRRPIDSNPQAPKEF